MLITDYLCLQIFFNESYLKEHPDHGEGVRKLRLLIEEHLVYGAVETKLISSSVFVSSLCKALYSTLCGLEPSDVCNVFVEHFDQLILDYSTPHWFVYVYLQIQ